MSCWLLCDQYFEMCQSRMSVAGKGAPDDDASDDQSWSKQPRDCGSVEVVPGGTVVVKHSDHVGRFCSEKKKTGSCFSLDCSEPIAVQGGRGNGRNRYLPGGSVGGRVLEEKNAGKKFGKSPKNKEQERALMVLDLSGCFRITDAGLR